jgi:hypothetical protein
LRILPGSLQTRRGHPVDGLPQPVGRGMGVDLRRADGGMTEKILDLVQRPPASSTLLANA